MYIPTYLTGHECKQAKSLASSAKKKKTCTPLALAAALTAAGAAWSSWRLSARHSRVIQSACEELTNAGTALFYLPGSPGD
jgi:hypothetical protein